MKVRIELGDIIEQKVDAVIYSTNSDFLLSGGVGKSLSEKYGEEVQHSLDRAIKNQIIGAESIGAVVNCTLSCMPWKLLLHTVVTNRNYVTDPDLVKQVLLKAIDFCDQTHGVYTIATSALGCGYGDLSHVQFIQILKTVAGLYEQSDLKEIVVVCNSNEYYDQMQSSA